MKRQHFIIAFVLSMSISVWAQDLFIYKDSLLIKNWSAQVSWSTNYNLSSTEYFYEGKKSISIEFQSGFAGFSLYTVDLNTSGYDSLVFFINGGTGSGQSFKIRASFDGATFNEGTDITKYTTVEANKWKEVKIPLKDFGAENNFILRLVFQENKGHNQPKFFIDNIYLKANPNCPKILDEYLDSYNLLPGDEVEARVKVVDAQGLSDINSVRINLKEVGLNDSSNLYDDGLHFDLQANDGVFGNKFKLPTNVNSGEYKLLLTAEDKAGNKALKNIWFGLMIKDTTSIPMGLPKFLSIGTATTTSEFSWMINNGNECWDAGYQYLTWGWWNWYSGGFVKRFCDNAERSGYIPILSLYLFQSGAQSFGCSGNEYDKIFCAINNSSLMNEFWNRFIQMCNEAKSSYAKKFIFHIEPDMLGYLQQRAIKENKNPSSISAYVGDSKYPNTLEGMHQRMVDLVREHCGNRGYIAWHASLWGNVISLKDNTEKFLNVDSLAKNTADFLMKCSPNCDLIFTDWSDRDAGYDDVWWDKKNLSVPNFVRAILFNNLISFYSKKKIVLWQIPIGNESLSNLPNQYKDNRLDYIFDYKKDLAKSGIISLLFGAGIPQMTTQFTDNGNLRKRALEYCSQGKIYFSRIDSPDTSYSNQPNNLILYQNFPNPFNPITYFQFDLPEVINENSGEKISEAFCSIKIYNSLGELIVILFEEVKKAGKYDPIKFNASKYGLGAGVYFVELRYGSLTSLIKMILLK